MAPRAVSLEEKREEHGLLRKPAKGHFVCDKEEEAHSQSQNLGSREIFHEHLRGQSPPLSDHSQNILFRLQRDSMEDPPLPSLHLPW